MKRYILHKPNPKTGYHRQNHPTLVLAEELEVVAAGRLGAGAEDHEAALGFVGAGGYDIKALGGAGLNDNE